MSDPSGASYSRTKINSGSSSPTISHSSSHRLNLPSRSHVQRYVPRSDLGRYKNALHTLLPVRFLSSERENIPPVDKAGLFSHMTLFWATKYLCSEDLSGTGSLFDSSDVNCERFQGLWQQEGIRSGQRGASLARIVWRFTRTRVIISCVLMIISLVISIFLPVFCVNNLMETKQKCNLTDYTHASQSDHQCLINSLTWIGILLAAEIVSLLLSSWSKGITHRTAIRLCSAYMALLHKKAIKTSVRNRISISNIVMLLVTDNQMMYNLILHGPYIFVLPAVYVTSICCLSVYFYSAFIETIIGFFMIALSVILLQIIFAQVECMLTQKIAKLQMVRLTTMEEMITNIGTIKMCNLEKLFIGNIKEKRRCEIEHLSWTSTYHMLGVSVSNIILLSAFVSYLAQVHTYLSLSSTEMIQKYAIFFIVFVHIQNSIKKFHTSVKCILQASSTMNHLKNLSLLDGAEFFERPLRNIAVSINKGYFSWTPTMIEQPKKMQNKKKLNSKKESVELNISPPSILRDITFEAGMGKLIGVCGDVRSGKSSLLMAIIGQLKRVCGEVQRTYNCSYVGQTPWICNGTLQENVTLKSPLDDKRYNDIITSCFLLEEEHMDTNLEKCCLSMAQKQKIALARALYSSSAHTRNVLLLDEPLSALDPYTAIQMFEQAIQSARKEKAVILVTHNIGFLAKCDHIYLLADGEIVDEGTHDLLLQRTDRYMELVDDYMRKKSKNYFVEKEVMKTQSFPKWQREANVSRASSHSELQNTGEADNDITEKSLCPIYFQHISYSWFIVSIITSISSVLLIRSLPFYFLIDTESDRKLICISFLSAMTASTLIWSITVSKANTFPSESLFHSWLQRIMKSQVHSLMNFTVSDILFDCFHLCFEDVDVRVPFWLHKCIESIVWIMIPVLIMGYACFWTLIPLFLYAACLVPLVLFYKKNVKRFDEKNKMTLLPLVDNMVNTVDGRVYIEAFGKGKGFVNDFRTLCDQYTENLLILKVSTPLLDFWIHLLSVLIAVMIIVLLTLYCHDYRWFTLSLLAALQIGKSVKKTVHAVIELLSKNDSLASKHIFIQNIEKGKNILKADLNKIPANWPTDGTIRFKDVYMGLASKCYETLSGMDFSINDGETVAIVEKPGSRMTPIVAALFRLSEVSRGKVYIGGTNILDVPLEKLRSSISIVPRNPVLFRGSLKLNLDPDSIYSDPDINECLADVNLTIEMWKIPSELPAGQRQLLYMAKALLNKTKVLVFEEALEPINKKEEEKILNVIKKNFCSSTVLMFTQSPQFIACCDRVMIIDKGKIVEFDTPSQLSLNPNSRFSVMMGNSFETSL